MRTTATAIALALGLCAAPAMAAPFDLSDGQMNAVAAGIRFTVTNRVSDVPGAAPVTDPLLKNPWGLSQAGPANPLWVANNHTGTSTLYNATTFAKVPLVVSVPLPDGTGSGAPTGTTFMNLSGTSFLVTAGGKTGPAIFTFATEEGAITAWSPGVDMTRSFVMVNEAAQGDVYKGLTLGVSTTGQRLFAADFANGLVDMFDTQFRPVGTFTDPYLPPGYAPFNVQELNGKLYVAFAKRDPGTADELIGRGLGIVSVFDNDGHFLQRLVTGGRLNAPWGLTIAPRNFGRFAGALLVGNFGDGTINAFELDEGELIGTLKDQNGNVTLDGLWGLRNGPNGTVTFSAGPNNEANGLVGSIGVDKTHIPFGGKVFGGLANVASFLEFFR